MKTKFTHVSSAILSFVLCVVMLLGTVLPVAAETQEVSFLDYSNPEIGNSITLSAYDLYTILLDRTPTNGETLYWKAHELSFSYSDFIPGSSVDTNYDKDAGVLTVTVSPYIYTAANGSLVTWVPEGFSLGNEKYTLVEENGVYIGRVENCYHSGDFDMQVEYGCQIEISQDVIQALLSEAYEKGNDALSEMNAYRKALDDYNALVAAHNAYNSFVKWEEDYADYLAKKAVYDNLLLAYEEYVVKYNTYLAEKDAYDQWATYREQKNAYEENKLLYAEYAAYQKAYEAAVNKLAMFESIFKRDSRGWSAYADIMGSTVTQVLEAQDMLSAQSGQGAGVNSAGAATEELRVLLKGYNNLRTQKWSSEYAKYQALYQYYIDNYDALKKNFSSLYKNLKDLYDVFVVQQFIGIKGKTEHYMQLVGHLYVISTALDQNVQRDEKNWKMKKVTLREAIEDVHYFPDGDWDPRNTPFPAAEVPYVEEMKEPVVPSVPQPSKTPKEPTEVKHPGKAPTEVENPANTPRPPKPEQEVGEMPVPPVFEKIQEVLYQEVVDGKLKAPEQSATAATLEFEKVIQLKVSIENLKTITFYNYDGSIYKQEQVHFGGIVNCDRIDREATAEYTYEFLGWNYADGSAVGGDSFVIEKNSNISLYPRYRSTKRMYTITWILDGKSYSQTLYYGVMPMPELLIDTTAKEDQYYRYEFSGWDQEVLPVTGDATYQGQMIRIPKKFNITWVIKNGTESITQQWEYNQTPVFEGDLSIPVSNHFYEFLDWDKSISPVTGDATYTALYRQTPLAVGGLNTVMEILHSETEIKVLATKSSVSVYQAARLSAEQGKTLTILWDGALSISMAGEELQAYINCGAPTMILQTGKDGNATIYDFQYFNVGAGATTLPCATVSFNYSKTDTYETVFDLQTASGWERAEGAQMTVCGNFKARAVNSYFIEVTPNNDCNISQMLEQAVEGEWVSIALDCVRGYKVTGATIVTAEGETITVVGTSFQMPSSPITITLNVERIVYTVTFMVDGQVWSQEQYYVGDQIVLPQTPTKEPVGEYTYTFIGWGDVPLIATGENENLVFEASFQQSQIDPPEVVEEDNGEIITIVLIAMGVVLVIVVVFLILRRIVRRRGGWRVVSAKVGARMRAGFKKTKLAIQKLFQKKK